MLKILALAAALLLSACATNNPLTLTQDAEENYNNAELYMENENYTRVTLFLEKFSAKFPYSKYATAAEFLRLKAAYLDGQYILSETLGLRFIDAHPEHGKRLQAEFYVAMSYYRQSSNAYLDQQFSHRARKAFLALNSNFPNNKYTKEVKEYIVILTNRIAEHEFLAGKYYYDRELYVAAINRFILVKNDYLEAESAAEGMYYLAASYLALKQTRYAKETISELKGKFPDSDWYEKAASLI